MSDQKIPKHLRASTKKWYASIAEDYELESHHLRLLTLACEAWDRCQDARKALAKHGTVYEDRFGMPKSRPEIAIERDSRVAFVRIIRELALDVGDEPAAEVRPPRVEGNAGLRIRQG